MNKKYLISTIYCYQFQVPCLLSWYLWVMGVVFIWMSSPRSQVLLRILSKMKAGKCTDSSMSITNVTNFIEHLNDPKILKDLLTALSSRLSDVTSGSESSDTDCDVTTNVYTPENGNSSTPNNRDDGLNTDITNNITTTDICNIADTQVFSNNSVTDISDAEVSFSTPNAHSTNNVISSCYDDYVDNFLPDSLCSKLYDHYSKAQYTSLENGHDVTAYGAPYPYVGSKQTSQPKPFPALVDLAVNEINRKYSSKHKISSLLVNRYTGPGSYLPEHSDNEVSLFLVQTSI